MKNMLKFAGIAAGMALVGASVYVMQNDTMKKKAGKKVLKAMDSAEDMIAKKIN